MTPHTPLRILLIEDSLPQQQLIKSYLSNCMAEPVSLEMVDHLSAGLKRIGEGGIDLVLLDLNLPDSIGLETFHQLRAHSAEIPVVILTGEVEVETVVAAIQRGASDYVPKQKLTADSLSRAVGFAVERGKREQAEQSLRQTDADLRIARRVQQRLLPTSAPLLPGFDIAGGCRPAAATGGDFFDYIAMPNGSWGIVIADVSTHGFAPALIMAETRRLMRTLVNYHSDIGEILTIANRALVEDTETEHFVTLFFAQLDPATGALAYGGAGHEGYVLDARGATRPLKSTGMPLGMTEDAVIATGTPASLRPGESLVLLTDGLLESKAPDGSGFGVEAALELIHTNRSRPAEEIVEALFGVVREFCHSDKLQDDATAVIVRRQS